MFCQATRLPLVSVVVVPHKQPVELWSILWLRTAIKPTRSVKRFRTSGIGDKVTVRQHTWYVLSRLPCLLFGSRDARRLLVLPPVQETVGLLARLRSNNKCHDIINYPSCI